jgi:hypothetical protein
MGAYADTELWRRVITSSLTQVMEDLFVRLVPSNYQIPLGTRTCGSQVMPYLRHSLICKFGYMCHPASPKIRGSFQLTTNLLANLNGCVVTDASDRASRHGTGGRRYVHARRTVLSCMCLSNGALVDNLFTPHSWVRETRTASTVRAWSW